MLINYSLKRTNNHYAEFLFAILREGIEYARPTRRELLATGRHCEAGGLLPWFPMQHEMFSPERFQFFDAVNLV